MPKYTARAEGPANPNAAIPTGKGLSMAGMMAPALSEASKNILRQQEASAASAAVRKKKQQEDNMSYAEKLRAAARAPAGMKKGGAVKKKVTVKAKPVVKAKARKK
jgi:hypothetical protein